MWNNVKQDASFINFLQKLLTMFCLHTYVNQIQQTDQLQANVEKRNIGNEQSNVKHRIGNAMKFTR